MTPTLGEIAETLVLNSHTLKMLLHATCIIVGAWLIIFSFVQYKNHRMNPKYVPLDRPVTYCILGLLLCILPVLGHFFGGKDHLIIPVNQVEKTITLKRIPDRTTFDIDAPASLAETPDIDAPLQ